MSANFSFLEPNCWTLSDPVLLLSLPNVTMEYKTTRQDKHLLGIYNVYYVKHIINATKHPKHWE